MTDDEAWERHQWFKYFELCGGWSDGDEAEHHTLYRTAQDVRDLVNQKNIKGDGRCR